MGCVDGESAERPPDEDNLYESRVRKKTEVGKEQKNLVTSYFPHFDFHLNEV
jgi:hypothetical protein